MRKQHLSPTMTYSQTKNIKEPIFLLVFSLLIVSLQATNRELGVLAIWFSLPVAAWIVLSANPRYLSILLVLYLPLVAFSNYGLSEDIPLLNILPTILLPDLVQFIPNGPQLSVSLVAIVTAFARTTYELIYSPKTYLGLVPNWIFFGWFLSLLIAIVACISNLENDIRGWSIAIKIVLSSGGFFWGIIVGSNSRQSIEESIRKLETYILISVFLCFIGILIGQAKFLIIGLSTGIISTLWHQGKKNLSITLFFAIILISLCSTFTSTMLFFICFLGATILPTIKKLLNPTIITWLTSFLIIAPVAVAIITFSINPTLITENNQTILTNKANELSVESRVNAKLLGDRGPIWIGVFKMISEEPYFIVPPGRTTTIEEGTSFKNVAYEFSAGAHNLPLEIFRQLGLVAGLLTSAIFINAIFQCSTIVFTEQKFLFLNHISMVFVLFLAITASSNHYLAGEGVGFLAWSLSGYLVALSRRSKVSINKYGLNNENR